jgi:putative AlgH/UPF0301 family transcriptional regulator
MDYPRYHKEIVGDLMNGKFILASDQKFVSLKDNAPFYEKFFKERVKKKNLNQKFFVVKGVSAWESQQLEEEIAENCWFVLPATAEVIFSARGKDNWPDLIKKLGIMKSYELVSYSGNC